MMGAIPTVHCTKHATRTAGSALANWTKHARSVHSPRCAATSQKGELVGGKRWRVLWFTFPFSSLTSTPASPSLMPPCHHITLSPYHLVTLSPHPHLHTASSSFSPHPRLHIPQSIPFLGQCICPSLVPHSSLTSILILVYHQYPSFHLCPHFQNHTP